MKQVIVIAAVLFIPSLAAGQETAGTRDARATASVRGTLVGADTGAPIAMAAVVIRRASKVVAKMTTDDSGRYRVDLAPGRYEVTFKNGESALVRFFEARKGKVARVNGRIRRQPGEVIVITDRRLSRPAKARNYDARRTPPYSDEAIKGNHWRRAWLLLDVSKKGRVTRLKFINRPGADLDEIAAAEAFKLEFNPSLDEDGKARTSLVVWSWEWPAYWWLVDRMGSSSAMPTENNPFWGTAGPAAAVGETPLRTKGGTNNRDLIEAKAASSTTPVGGFGTGFRNVTGHRRPTN